MRIDWISHSCFVVDHDGVRLLADPWLEGRVFDRSWDFLSLPRFPYEAFNDITHVWISHEHPDHYSPVTLRKIPDAAKKHITVLFQENPKTTVIEDCRSFGFEKTITLSPGRQYTLSEDFHVLCEPCLWGDSWLCVKSRDCTILNLNDCDVETTGLAAQVQSKVGKIDVLLCAFSYACWVGNRKDHAAHRAAARAILENLKARIRIFRPRYYLPSASFVWWCHEENFDLNYGINRVSHVVEAFDDGEGPAQIVLYPGDQWQVGAQHDPEEAAAKYDQDYERVISSPVLERTQTVAWGELTRAADRYLAGGRWMDPGPPPVHAYLQDHGIACRLHWRDGITKTDKRPHNCDIILTSSALGLCFASAWGPDDLFISARYDIPPGKDYATFSRFLRGRGIRRRHLLRGLAALGRRFIQRGPVLPNRP